MPCSKEKFRFIENIDIFGKNVELYYKGKGKQKTYTGSLLTIIYGLIYISFFLYKLIRMLKRKDLTFYDTYAYIDEPPIINITNEIFYGGFALEDPITFDTFIDESIYYPKAFFKTGKRDGDDWEWEIKDVELEICKLEKFGSLYREKFTKKALHTLYCFKEVNETLIGHYSYDYYSFYYIEFFPCISTTENNNHCKPLEIIDYYLKSTFLTFQLQDVELTPQNYRSPVRVRDQDAYTTVGKKLYQEIHVYFQIVNIETDLDIIGFTEFQYYRAQKYLKYDETVQMTNINEEDIHETGNSFCDVTLKLSEKVLTERRRFTKLIEVLRDVGGFTEVILSLFQVISSFSMDLLYETSLINNLFDFDIDKKLIFVHNRYLNKLFKNEKNEIINEDINFNYPKNFNIYKSMNNLDNILNKDNLNNEKDLISRNRKDNNIEDNKDETNNKIIIKRDDTTNNSILKNDTELNYTYIKQIISERNGEEKKKINNIKNNRFCIYLCFLCVRKRKNLTNILLDEGKKLIIEKLDIIYIFKKLFHNEDALNNEGIIKMSDSCKKKLNDLNNI